MERCLGQCALFVWFLMLKTVVEMHHLSQVAPLHMAILRRPADCQHMYDDTAMHQ